MKLKLKQKKKEESAAIPSARDEHCGVGLVLAGRHFHLGDEDLAHEDADASASQRVELMRSLTPSTPLRGHVTATTTLG